MKGKEAKQASADIASLRNSKRAIELQRFFQTGPGQYGEGDLFLGLTVPQIRSVASKYKNMPMADISELVESDFHEERFCGLVILTEQFVRSNDQKFRKKIYEFYVKKIRSGQVNNWDLIDVPGSRIGEHLLTVEDPLNILIKYAKSNNLWIRRSAVIFTFPFIRIGEFQPTLKICKILIEDKHDLIHKATGWALREVGKRNIKALRNFLESNAKLMPRTMLRYAIEKLPQTERKHWLSTSK